MDFLSISLSSSLFIRLFVCSLFDKRCLFVWLFVCLFV